jgi:hypothetical protein
MSAKTGRNDACPCGSGRKYKRCCLAKDAERERPWQRLRQVHDDLTGELVAYGQARFGDEYAETAWREFHLWDEPPSDAEGEPIDLSAAFVPWLLYCFTPDPDDEETPSGWPERPLALCYLEERGARLTELERRFLAAACEPAFSFHVVEAVDPGKGMQLRDLLTGEKHDLQERLGSETVSPGSVVYARAFSLDGVSALLGCGPVVLPARRQLHILDFREALAGRGAMLAREELADFDAEIRERYLALLDALYHPLPPILQNTDGEALEPCKLFFELACSPGEAFAALRDLSSGASDEELLAEARRDRAGAVRSLEFPWLRCRDSTDAGFECTILGNLAIDGARLTAEVNSRERAERIRAEIESRLGSRVRFKRERGQSFEAMLRAIHAQAVWTPTQERSDRGRRPEELPELRRLREEHWDRWLDEPVPALGDETPRQAATSERGRERLEALLAGYAAGAGGAGDAFSPPDLASLRERLGLAPRPEPRRVEPGKKESKTP